MKAKPYKKYKPSGVDWLGDVPEHWEVKRIKHLGAIRYGLGEPPEYADDGLPFIRATDIDHGKIDLSLVKRVDPNDVPWHRRPLLEWNEILVVRSGAYTGDSAIVSHDVAGCVAGYDMVLTVQKANPNFIAWVMLAKYMLYGQIYLERMRAAQPHLNAEELGSFFVFLPPLPEQQAIATYLDREAGKIDAVLAKKRELIERLKEKRTALISAVVTGRRGIDGKPYKTYKPSGVDWLGDIPEHWNVKKLKYLLQSKKGAIKTGPFGTQLLSTEMLDEDVKVYNQKSVISKDFYGGDNYISLEKFKELQSFETFPGDFLITTRGTIGRCAILPNDAEKGILHPCLMRLQIDKTKVVDRFLEIQIQESKLILEQVSIASNGTTIEVIYQDTLKNVMVILPPASEQQTIAAYLDHETSKLDALIGKVETAMERLREYRTALISAAVTGKIDVRNEVQ